VKNSVRSVLHARRFNPSRPEPQQQKKINKSVFAERTEPNLGKLPTRRPPPRLQNMIPTERTRQPVSKHRTLYSGFAALLS
jgi:hypothetical protein